MSVAENKGLVRRYLEEVVNAGDVNRLDEFIAPDYVDRNDPGRGIEGAKRHVLGVRQTYPDLYVTVGQQVAEGEWVVTRVTGRGTHLGAWLGMGPTGKTVEITEGQHRPRRERPHRGARRRRRTTCRAACSSVSSRFGIPRRSAAVTSGIYPATTDRIRDQGGWRSRASASRRRVRTSTRSRQSNQRGPGFSHCSVHACSA